MVRTRSLLSDVVLVVIGPTGIVHHDGGHWTVVAGDVVVTRGHDEVEL
jgi:quercetin dioxygenase-like cupin family protein